MTIKDSGLCHFKDMDKTILIFKDINCFGSIAYGFVCRYFVRILKFASHCRCTKLSVQSGDAELQSEIVAKLVPGSGGTQLAIFHPPGPGGSCCTLGWEFAKFVHPGAGSFAQRTLRPGQCGSQLAISLRNLKLLRPEPVLMGNRNCGEKVRCG